MNAFDSIRVAAFNTVASVMGYTAVWIPSAGTQQAITAEVILKNPTAITKISDREYDPTDWEMEYTEGDFTGLKEAVDNRETNEKVTINGNDFFVNTITKKYDGQTYIAKLNPVQ